MFDMSWGEVMLIGGVALIVIGPKELPKALRTVGQVTSKLKRMAFEFQGQFNEAMREAELDEVRKDVEGIKSSVATSMGTGGFNPIQTIRDELKGAVEGKATPATGEALAAATAKLESEREALADDAPLPPSVNPMPLPDIPVPTYDAEGRPETAAFLDAAPPAPPEPHERASEPAGTKP